MSKITTAFETIGPKEASDLMKNNVSNRPLNVRYAKQIADAIKRSEWAVNGDAIRVSETGRLLDGQHRLSAVITAQTAIQTLVIRGLPNDVFDTIDQGARRTTGQILSVGGVKHANVIASAARLLHKWLKHGDPYNQSPETIATTRQVERLFSDRPDLASHASWVSQHKKTRRLLNPGLAVFLRAAFFPHDQQKAEEFFELLDSGLNITAGSPVYHLRERLSAASEASSRAQARMPPFFKCALAFKAFRKFCAGDTVAVLRVPLDLDRHQSVDLFSLKHGK